MLRACGASSNHGKTWCLLDRPRPRATTSGDWSIRRQFHPALAASDDPSTASRPIADPVRLAGGSRTSRAKRRLGRFDWRTDRNTALAGSGPRSPSLHTGESLSSRDEGEAPNIRDRKRARACSPQRGDLPETVALISGPGGPQPRPSPKKADFPATAPAANDSSSSPNSGRPC